MPLVQRSSSADLNKSSFISEKKKNLQEKKERKWIKEKLGLLSKCLISTTKRDLIFSRPQQKVHLRK